MHNFRTSVLSLFGLLAPVAVSHAQVLCSTQEFEQTIPASPIVGQPFQLVFTTDNTDGSPPIMGSTTYGIEQGYGFGNGAGSGTGTFVNGVATFTAAPIAQPGGYSLYATEFISGPDNCSYPAPVESTIYVVPASGAEWKLLAGQYTFLLRGRTNVVSGGADEVTQIGVIDFDGEGNVQSGEEDLNSSLGTLTAIPITGTYTLNQSNQGTLTLTTPEGTQHFAISSSSGKTIALISTDPSGIFTSGSAVKQVLPVSANGLVQGTYQFNLDGEVPCTNNCASRTVSGAVSAGGLLLFNTSVQSLINQTTETTIDPAAYSLSGSFTGTDQDGRFTFTLTDSSGEPSFEPTHFVGYAAGTGTLFLMSTDSHAQTILLSGKASQ